MDPAVFQRRMNEATVMFEYAVSMCVTLHEHGLKFVLEHPCAASSWQNAKFQAFLRQLGKDSLFSFDQCSVGLCSPDGKSKLRKRTRFFTNARVIKEALSNCKCNCAEHMRIIGWQQGVQLSTHAQVWPDMLCKKVVEAATHL